MYPQDQNKMIMQSSSVHATWTNHDHTMFLHAVANGPDDITGRWQELADAIPGKTAEEVKAYYEAVERDLLDIEAGRVELPVYADDVMGEEPIGRVKKEDEVVSDSGSELLATGNCGSKRQEKERKKATPWTEEEHRRFLQGLKVYGKGDWRSISRIMVVTRTATQVASHAQKYFLRQASLKEDNKNEENNNKKKKKRRRCSIHDITDAPVVVQAQPSPSTPSATSLNGGDQGIEVPTPTTLSPQCGQFKSLALWPGMQGTTTTDTTMVVHAQPISSTPQPLTSFYGGSQGGGAPQPLTSFYGGQGGGEPQLLNSFYGGQGGGAPSHPTQPPANFYGEQGVPLRYEFIKHLAPAHVKDCTVDEEFSFKDSSYLSETNL